MDEAKTISRNGGTTDTIDGIVARWADVRPDLETESTQIIGRLLRIDYFITRREAEALAPHKLNLGEFNVLASLRRAGKPYALLPNQLQDTILVSPGALTNRIDRLVSAGYVTRFPGENDRRSVVVQLTEQGLEKVDQAIADILAVERELISCLSGIERAGLEDALRTLLQPHEKPKETGSRKGSGGQRRAGGVRSFRRER